MAMSPIASTLWVMAIGPALRIWTMPPGALLVTPAIAPTMPSVSSPPELLLIRISPVCEFSTARTRSSLLMSLLLPIPALASSSPAMLRRSGAKSTESLVMAPAPASSEIRLAATIGPPSEMDWVCTRTVLPLPLSVTAPLTSTSSLPVPVMIVRFRLL